MDQRPDAIVAMLGSSPRGDLRSSPPTVPLQRAAPSLRASTRGTEHGAFVLSSKKGVGRASPRIHQLKIFVARRAKIPSEGGGAAFGGSGPTAERS